MTDDEARVVLKAMAAMWPNHELSKEQVAIWNSHFTRISYDDAIAVVTLLERTTKFWPHWSEFVAVYEPIIRRRAERLTPALGERVCTPEENAEWLKKCRAIVANAKGPLGKSLRENLR